MVQTRRAKQPVVKSTLAIVPKHQGPTPPRRPSKAKRKTRKEKNPKRSSHLTNNADGANSTSDDFPWYRRFTRGDTDYDEYMATEWGFEKVSFLWISLYLSRLVTHIHTHTHTLSPYIVMLYLFILCCALSGQWSMCFDDGCKLSIRLKRGDVQLFEKMSLEGAQSGLSWLTILRKRKAYRRTFHNFDIDKVAAMTPKDVEKMLEQKDPEPTNMVVRHRGKIEATINNAKCIQKLRSTFEDDEQKSRKGHNETQNNAEDHDSYSGDNHGCFDDFLWGFVDNKPILNRWNGNMADALSKSDESEAMSKALKRMGFKFVGATTCYAMMQSVGMVIDHPENSPEWEAAYQRLRSRPSGYQERHGSQ